MIFNYLRDLVMKFYTRYVKQNIYKRHQNNGILWNHFCCCFMKTPVFLRKLRYFDLFTWVISTCCIFRMKSNFEKKITYSYLWKILLFNHVKFKALALVDKKHLFFLFNFLLHFKRFRNIFRFRILCFFSSFQRCIICLKPITLCREIC